MTMTARRMTFAQGGPSGGASRASVIGSRQFVLMKCERADISA